MRVESYVFKNCASLRSIVVEEENPKYDSRNNCNAIIDTEANELIVGCSATIIPDSVRTIGRGAFSGCALLTSIIIPDSVEAFGIGAFEDCSMLTNIQISDGVTGFNYGAFSGCTSLESITIPKSVTWILGNIFEGCHALKCIAIEEGNLKYDSRNNCNAIIETENNELIIGCSATSIPESVTKIGEKAFLNCASLTSIVIPKGVKKIESFAFEKCHNLESVALPVGVNKIGEHAFRDCSALQTIYVPAKKTDYYKKRLCSKFRDKIVELEPVKK